MPNNNPGGVNSYGGFGQEAPYGQIEREKVLTQAAPVKTPGGNAAQKSQRAATKGKSAPTRGTAPAPAAEPSAPAVMPPSAQVAAFWAAMAAEPGASPLIQQIAAEANGPAA